MAHDPDRILAVSAPTYPDSFPDGETPAALSGDVETGSHTVEIRRISLTNIRGNKVVYALLSGAAAHLVMKAACEADTLEELPSQPFRIPTLAAIDVHLKTLRKQLPADELATALLDEHPLPGTPPLPGFSPFAREISVETIEALDDRYGAGFTEHCLQELTAKRDDDAQRRAAAGRTAGMAVVAATLDAQGEAPTDDGDTWLRHASLEHDPLAEYFRRCRQGQMFVGDMEFPIWYSLLHAAAAEFAGVAPIDPYEVEKKMAMKAAAEQPLIMMSSRTGLPLLRSTDENIDVDAINQAFYERGWRNEDGHDFVYYALLPALEIIRERSIKRHRWTEVPSAETEAERAERLEELRQAASDPDSYANTAILFRPQLPRGRQQPELRKEGTAPRPVSGARVTLHTLSGRRGRSMARVSPRSTARSRAASGAAQGRAARVAPRLRPSDRTRARIRELNVAMDQSSGPISWGIAGFKRWGRFIVLGAQRITRN